MSIFIKAGLWLEKKTGYKGEFNLTRYITDLIADSPSGSTYKVYTALLSQTGENAPVPTVLENTLGETLSYTRSVEGIYVITTTGIFPQNKTWAVINTPSYEGNGPFALQIGRVNDTQCQIYSYQLPDTLIDLGTNSDRVSIEIRVYN
jgi:hypothetical protein